MTEENGLFPLIGVIAHLFLPLSAAQDYRTENMGVEILLAFFNTLDENSNIEYTGARVGVKLLLGLINPMYYPITVLSKKRGMALCKSISLCPKKVAAKILGITDLLISLTTTFNLMKLWGPTLTAIKTFFRQL